MRKLQICLFGLLSLITACSEDDEPKKNIATVAVISDIKVAFGTVFSSLSLPTEVSVTYSDNTSENVAVTFSDAGYTPTLAGTYTIEGTLNPSSQITNTGNLKAAVKIIVAPLKLKSTTEDGQLKMQYFYDSLHRLDHYRVYNGANYMLNTPTPTKLITKLKKESETRAGHYIPKNIFITAMESSIGSNSIMVIIS